MARAMRSPAGARRSTVMVAAMTAIARRSMTPMTRRIAIRPTLALGVVEPEAQAVSPGRAGVGRQRTAAPACLPAAGVVTRLPRGELAGAGHQDDHPDPNRCGP